MNTVDALLREITAKPEDDTLRLALADCYDEHGEPERAESIRVQVELRTLPSKGHGKGQYHREKLRTRERELTDALGKRLSAPCPGCKDGYPGWGKDASGRSLQADTNCLTCHGTGDLFAVRYDNGATTRPRPHRWHRGCLYLDVTLGNVCREVYVCGCGAVHLTDLGTCTGCMGRGHSRTVRDWRPTPWAAALPPEVVGLWCVDQEPFPSAQHIGWFRWYTDEIPRPVYELLQGEYPESEDGKSLQSYYPSPHLARLHLAHAIRQWVYDCTSRDKTTT